MTSSVPSLAVKAEQLGPFCMTVNVPCKEDDKAWAVSSSNLPVSSIWVPSVEGEREADCQIALELNPSRPVARSTKKRTFVWSPCKGLSAGVNESSGASTSWGEGATLWPSLPFLPAHICQIIHCSTSSRSAAPRSPGRGTGRLE